MTSKVCAPDSLLQYISVIFLFKKKKNRKEKKILTIYTSIDNLRISWEKCCLVAGRLPGMCKVLDPINTGSKNKERLINEI